MKWSKQNLTKIFHSNKLLCVSDDFNVKCKLMKYWSGRRFKATNILRSCWMWMVITVLWRRQRKDVCEDNATSGIYCFLIELERSWMFHFRWYRNLIKEKHACLFFVSERDCEFALQKLPSLFHLQIVHFEQLWNFSAALFLDRLLNWSVWFFSALAIWHGLREKEHH